MSKQDRHGKSQLGVWLTPGERENLNESIEALGRKSFADLVRRLLWARSWDQTQVDAFDYLTDPAEIDPEELGGKAWLLLRVSRETLANLQQLGVKWHGTPQQAAEVILEEEVSEQVKPKSQTEITKSLFDTVEKVVEEAEAGRKRELALKERVERLEGILDTMTNKKSRAEQ